MIRRILVLLTMAAAMPAGHAASQAPPEARMTAAERAEAIELLLKSEKEFLASLEGLTEAQWSFKPAPERWSVGEVAEHIVLADAALFGMSRKLLTGAQDPEWAATNARTDRLRNALPNRTTRVDAPGELRPQQAMSRAQILARYKEQRAQALAFAKETDAPLKAYTAKNPFFGVLNAYQWFIYAPLHNLRHNKQIAEVKADPRYPQR